MAHCHVIDTLILVFEDLIWDIYVVLGRSTICFYVDKEPLRRQLIDVFYRQPTPFITRTIVRVDLRREPYMHDIACLTDMLFYHFLATCPTYRAVTTMILRVPHARKRLDEFVDDLCSSNT